MNGTAYPSRINISLKYVTVLLQKMFDIKSMGSEFQARLQNFEKRLLAFSCLSVRQSARMKNSTPSRHIFMKFQSLIFFENFFRKSRFY
jgi:hypothetical protein